MLGDSGHGGKHTVRRRLFPHPSRSTSSGCRSSSTGQLRLVALFVVLCACVILAELTWILSQESSVHSTVDHVHPGGAVRGVQSSTGLSGKQGGDGAAAAVSDRKNNHTATAATDHTDTVQGILRTAGVSDDWLQQHLHDLPTWDQVTREHGEAPVVVGLDSCAAYRAAVPPDRRMLGAAGMFSTGTNLMTVLLKQNCVIPERAAVHGWDATKEQLGMRWQVPWGKHTPQHYKWKHATKQASAIRKEDVLPIVTTRNPWRWMQSMCKNPYAAKWPHFKQCPNLLKSGGDDGAWNTVSVKYGAATETYQSLIHLWNDWYNDYFQMMTSHVAPPDATAGDGDKDDNAVAPYPFLMIRMEDLIFFTRETVTQVCECAGGVMDGAPGHESEFHYITESAKADSPGHDTSTGLAEAWIKYSKPLEPGAGFSEEDYDAALHAVDQDLMDTLHYHHPPAPPPKS